MIWEVLAVRYALDPLRRAAQNFLGGTDNALMPMAYHAFILRGPPGVVMVDTGADAARCERMGKQPGRGIAEALDALGIAPGDVQHVVQTHLHWDHAGGTALFPNACFHMQAREMAYCTGPAMRHTALRAGYDVLDIAAVVALFHAGRMQLHDGAVQLYPGLRLSHVGGHTDGLQVLDVDTRRGRVCLAGDAVVFRENLVQRKPFPALFHVGDALDAFDTVLALADGPALVIPGHDPWVVDAHPPAEPGTDGWIARLG